MNVRQTLILVVVFVLGILTAGAFIGRPAAAEPKADAGVAGRYQIVPLTNHNADGSVVVMDTATGECWQYVGADPPWHEMGSPAKAK